MVNMKAPISSLQGISQEEKKTNNVDEWIEEADSYYASMVPGQFRACVKTWLLTLSLVGRGSSVVGAMLQNLGKFVYPTSTRPITKKLRQKWR